MNMGGAEARAAERERELRERIDGRRRLAGPEDYVFDKAQEAFWDLRDGTLHSEKAVDASIPVEAWRVVVEEGSRGRSRERLVNPSRDIMRVENDQFVEGSTWWPGRPQIIRDWFIDRDGFYPSPGRRIYNQYKPPPTLLGGDPALASPWIDHVRRLWPEPREHEYFFDYCAHMIQRPEQKCNAALVLSGTQGIGKDAALWPVKLAVGSWNVKGIDPDELFSAYKPWLQTLMLTIDEVRPSKDEFHASSMYNILKPMIVAPPDTLPLNDKYQKLRYVINVLRVFITTNDWMSMYIPPEDRRMFIMHSHLPQRWHEAEGDAGYFERLFGFFETGGGGHVAAWLKNRDLSSFSPKAQIDRTSGWAAVANSWGEPEDAVTGALDALGAPEVVFGAELVRAQFDGAEEIAGLIRAPRRFVLRMSRAGYTSVRPPNSAERWSFGSETSVFRSRLAFVKSTLIGTRPSAEINAMIRAKGSEIAAKIESEGGHPAEKAAKF